MTDSASGCEQLTVALQLMEGERRLLLDTGGPDTSGRALKHGEEESLKLR